MRLKFWLIKREICLVFLLFSVLILSGCSKDWVHYDFNGYLNEGTAFEENIKSILPSKEDLSEEKVVYYLHYNDKAIFESTADSLLQLTVEYSEEGFEKAQATLEKHMAAFCESTEGESFFYNGVLFRGFMFYDQRYCAVVYHLCPGTKTISYIAFSCEELSYLSIEDAIKDFSFVYNL